MTCNMKLRFGSPCVAIDHRVDNRAVAPLRVGHALRGGAA
jgi:hypothetical protein